MLLKKSLKLLFLTFLLGNESEINNKQNIDDVDNIIIRWIDIRFKLRNDLIYYTNFDNNKKRLYIFNIFEQEVFKLTHNY